MGDIEQNGESNKNKSQSLVILESEFERIYSTIKNFSDEYAEYFLKCYSENNAKQYVDVIVDEIYLKISSDLDTEQKLKSEALYNSAQQEQRDRKIEAVKLWYINKTIPHMEIFSIKSGGFVFFNWFSKKSTKILLIRYPNTSWFKSFSHMREQFPEASFGQLNRISSLEQKRTLMNEYGYFLLAAFYAN